MNDTTLSELVGGNSKEPTPVHCERVWVNWQAIQDLFYPRVSANKQARYKASHRGVRHE